MGISDTTWIAGLLLVAILVSAIGTLTVLTKPTGLVTTQTVTTNATVAQTVVIALPTDSINFGNINVGQSANTTANLPPPFHVRNDGNVNINISLNSTPLWTRQQVTSAFYQFQCGDEGGTVCPEGSIAAYTPMLVNGAATPVIANMSWTGGIDVLEVEILITAPLDEPAGAKSAIVAFTGSAA